jgi:hypothetical protein
MSTTKPKREYIRIPFDRYEEKQIAMGNLLAAADAALGWLTLSGTIQVAKELGEVAALHKTIRELRAAIAKAKGGA